MLCSVKQLTEVDAAIIGAFVTSPAGWRPGTAQGS
jgi:hypothetical protein